MSHDEPQPRARAHRPGLPVAERLLRRFTDAGAGSSDEHAASHERGGQGVDGLTASGRAARRGDEGVTAGVSCECETETARTQSRFDSRRRSSAD